MGETWKTKQALSFRKEHLKLQGRPPFVRVSPWLKQEEADQISGTLTKGEGCITTPPLNTALFLVISGN